MKFWASMVFSPPGHYLGLAPALENAGFTGMLLADHLVTVQSPRSRYPYSADGLPPWDATSPFPDVWVTAGAVTAVTRSLRVGSSVYIAPARDVFTVAKQVSTAAVLSDNRITLGVGAGWLRDEFQLTGQAFSDRGARLDEMIDVLRLLWTDGWVEHHGTHFDFGPVQMQPTPTRVVPIWGGGYSAAALRRAAGRCDGWVGVASDAEQAERVIRRLREELDRAGKDHSSFEIAVSLTEPITQHLVEQWSQRGVTALIARPWAGTLARDLGGLREIQGSAALDRKREAVASFGDDIISRATTTTVPF